MRAWCAALVVVCLVAAGLQLRRHDVDPSANPHARAALVVKTFAKRRVSSGSAELQAFALPSVLAEPAAPPASAHVYAPCRSLACPDLELLHRSRAPPRA